MLKISDMKYHFIGLLLVVLAACSTETASIHPVYAPITSSIYASGVIKSIDQYQVFSTVNGIIEEVYVSDGEVVKKGQILLKIANPLQQLSIENADLSARYLSVSENQAKLYDAKQVMQLAEEKKNNDSLLFVRQQRLWNQGVGSIIELEQRSLAVKNAQSAYLSAMIRFKELKRQIALNADQAAKSSAIARQQGNDALIKSQVDGIVFAITSKKGEMVSVQTPIATIGNNKHFLLEMQVDENDINAIKIGQQVYVTIDSYKDRTFEAKVTKIIPIMNERSKSFTVEATFITPPPTIYPNSTFEANILLQSKAKALLIPRSYLSEKNTVTLKSGKKITVKTGLLDFQQVEILSGLSVNDELIENE